MGDYYEKSTNFKWTLKELNKMRWTLSLKKKYSKRERWNIKYENKWFNWNRNRNYYWYMKIYLSLFYEMILKNKTVKPTANLDGQAMINCKFKTVWM